MCEGSRGAGKSSDEPQHHSIARNQCQLNAVYESFSIPCPHSSSTSALKLLAIGPFRTYGSASGNSSLGFVLGDSSAGEEANVDRGEGGWKCAGREGVGGAEGAGREKSVAT